MITNNCSPFQISIPNIKDNTKLRKPQLEFYEALENYINTSNEEREIGVILPVGCGKSGCITLTPFAFKSKRTLVIAPNISIAEQLHQDFNPSNDNMFYQKCRILNEERYPETVEIRGEKTNASDINEADVVITNIQQLQGGIGNKWLKSLQEDFFDLIIFDEGHHSVAASYILLKQHFPLAKIVNFSATPLRADGRKMAGIIIYSYPIYQAIQEGYIKNLKAIQLNPNSLKYVRKIDNQEIEVSLEEVRELGENEAGFRRSIVTSKETLDTIIDASIRELRRLRTETKENRLKIIASALNQTHCIQVVEAYRERDLRADYVHAELCDKINQKIKKKLENHELDVIVQVRKLGEGFDHPYLSVATVLNVFSHLSPFVQFVGRIMRVIKQNSPNDILNQGVVIYHAGANIAKRWEDFQTYSEADQEFFDKILPIQHLTVNDSESEREIKPQCNFEQKIEITQGSEVTLEEIQLINNKEIENSIAQLKKHGMIPEDYDPTESSLKPIPLSKQKRRRAKRTALDDRIKNETGRILQERNINSSGLNLDKTYQKNNFIFIKSKIDREVTIFIGEKKQRKDFSLEELESIENSFNDIVQKAIQGVFE